MKRNLLKSKLMTTCMIFSLAASGPAAAYAFAAEDVMPPSANTEAPMETADVKTPSAETPVPVISEEEIDNYYKNAVFVGDSIMLGFRNYCMKQKDSYLNNIQFLAAGSFSVTNSLWDVTAKSVHPVYKGQKRQVWESISMMETDKVFLFFGMNDLNVSGLEGTVEKYKQLIANIKEKSPDVEIHIISMTYTLKDAGKGKLKNPKIREFNELLKAAALENGWGYLDMATPLATKDGDLAPAYCSDGFVHQSRAAYDVWNTVIRDYARAQLDGTSEYPAALPEAEECPGSVPCDVQPSPPVAKQDFRTSAGFSAESAAKNQ